MDRVAGTHESVPFESLGDFPVTRKTGEAAYQLAVVVDDALMHVDDVVRGYDLLPSTFRQLDLFEALGWTPPRYSHVALVVGQDGLRLAKRHGDTRMSHFRDLGVDPRLIVRWGACSSGIELPTTAGAWSLETLQDYCIEQFAWERLSVQSIVTPTSF
jgi:glutamyl-tRNA synthetase